MDMMWNNEHWVHFLNDFLFLADPEGLTKKTSKNGLDLNQYDDMKKMRSNFFSIYGY